MDVENVLNRISSTSQFSTSLDILKDTEIAKPNSNLLRLIQKILWLNNQDLKQFNGLILVLKVLEEGLKNELTDAEWLKCHEDFSKVVVAAFESFLKYRKTDLIRDTELHEVITRLESVLLPIVFENDLVRASVIKEGFNLISTFLCLEELNLGVRKEVFRLVKPIFVKTDPHQRRFIMENSSLILTSLAKLVLHCGDFEMQEGIMEILMRFSFVSRQKLKRVISWFQSFLNDLNVIKILDYHNFDVSCREFLNTINSAISSDVKVITLPCIEALANEIQLKKPENEKYRELWVDFSTGTGMLHLTCDCGGNVWLKLIIDEGNVKKITHSQRTVKDSQEVDELLFQLSSPLQVWLYTSEKSIVTVTLTFLKSKKITELQTLFFHKWYKNIYKDERVNTSIIPGNVKSKTSDKGSVSSSVRDCFCGYSASISSIHSSSRRHPTKDRGILGTPKASGVCSWIASTPRPYDLCRHSSSSKHGGSSFKGNLIKGTDCSNNEFLFAKFCTPNKNKKESILRYSRTSESMEEDKQFKETCEKLFSGSKQQGGSSISFTPDSSAKADKIKCEKQNETLVTKETQYKTSKNVDKSISNEPMLYTENEQVINHESELTEDSPFILTSLNARKATSFQRVKSFGENKNMVLSKCTNLPSNLPAGSQFRKKEDVSTKKVSEKSFTFRKPSILADTNSKYTIPSSEKKVLLQPAKLNFTQPHTPRTPNDKLQFNFNLGSSLKKGPFSSSVEPHKMSGLGGEPTNLPSFGKLCDFSKASSSGVRQSFLTSEKPSTSCEKPLIESGKVSKPDVPVETAKTIGKIFGVDSGLSDSSSYSTKDKIPLPFSKTTKPFVNVDSMHKSTTPPTLQKSTEYLSYQNSGKDIDEPQTKKLKLSTNTAKAPSPDSGFDAADHQENLLALQEKIDPADKILRTNTDIKNASSPYDWNNNKSPNDIGISFIDKFISFKESTASGNIATKKSAPDSHVKSRSSDIPEKVAFNADNSADSFAHDTSVHCQIPSRTYSSIHSVKSDLNQTSEKLFDNLKKRGKLTSSTDGNSLVMTRKKKLFNPKADIDEPATLSEKGANMKLGGVNENVNVREDKAFMRRNDFNTQNFSNRSDKASRNKEDESRPLRMSLRPRTKVKYNENFTFENIVHNDVPKKATEFKRPFTKRKGKSISKSIYLVYSDVSSVSSDEGPSSPLYKHRRIDSSPVPPPTDTGDHFISEFPAVGATNFPMDIPEVEGGDVLRDVSHCELGPEEVDPPIEAGEGKGDDSLLEMTKPPLRLSNDDSSDAIMHAAPDSATHSRATSTGSQQVPDAERAFLNVLISGFEKFSVEGNKKKVMTEIGSLDRALKTVDLFVKSSNKNLSKKCSEMKKNLTKLKNTIDNTIDGLIASCDNSVSSYQTKMDSIHLTVNRLSKTIENNQEVNSKLIGDLEKLCKKRRDCVIPDGFT